VTRKGQTGRALILALLLAFGRGPVEARVIHASPAPDAHGDGSPARPVDLASAVRLAQRMVTLDAGAGATVQLAPGDYHLAPRDTIEYSCGNCERPDTTVNLTYGLRVSGRGIRIRGAPDHGSVLHTNAGYGVWFQDCQACALEGVVVTGGERDTSGIATDGAVVVQRSSVRIEDNWIRENIGDSTTVARHVVGIAGIVGREGSRIRILRNEITRCSWDGIALYRGAEAEIVDNRIDGVDLALGRRIGGGRGVGIGCTWDSRAAIRGNLVRRYWKGIGLFVDAEGVIEDNVVNEIATWGLSLWDAGRGACRGRFRWNVVDSTGACGASIASTTKGGDPGWFNQNALLRTGQNPRYDSGEPYCFQTAIAVHEQPEHFQIEGNLVFQNRTPGDAPSSGDLSEDTFRIAAQTIVQRLALHSATRASGFFRRYSRTPGGERLYDEPSELPDLSRDPRLPPDLPEPDFGRESPPWSWGQTPGARRR